MITEAKFDWLLKNLEENKSKTQRAIANARRVHEARISQIVSVLTRQGWTEVYVKGTQVYGEQGLLGGAHLVVNITDGVMSFREYLDSQESLLQEAFEIEDYKDYLKGEGAQFVDLDDYKL